MDAVELLVYRRPGRSDESAEALLHFPDRIRFAEAPLLDISSAAIRARIKTNRSIRHLVPDAVFSYIQQHGLYELGERS